MSRQEEVRRDGAGRAAVTAATVLFIVGMLGPAKLALGQPPRARSTIEGVEPGSEPPLVYQAVRIKKDGPLVSKVWIPRDDLRPLARPLPNAPLANNLRYLNSPPPFMHPASIAAEANGFLLLVEARPADDTKDNPTQLDLIGWVEAAKVLTWTTAPQDTATEIPRQCLLINTFDSNGKPHFSQAVDYRSRPDGSSGRSLGSDNLRAHCYVYAEEGPGDDGWLLLGRAPSFEPENSDLRPTRDAKAVVRGWVPKLRTLPVVTREYIEWDARTTWPEERAAKASPRPIAPGTWIRREPQGKVFEDTPSSRGALLGSPAGTVPKVRVEEDILYLTNLTRWTLLDQPPRATDPVLKISRTLDPRSPRYPLLPIPDLMTTDGPPVRHVQNRSRNHLYHVGAFGNLGRGRDGGKLYVDPEIDRVRVALNAIREQARAIQVVIAIDRTQSMEAYYPAVADFVESLVQALRAHREDIAGRTIELAVSYYDDNQESLNGEQHPLINLEDEAAVKETLDRLRQPAIDNKNDGAKELVFDGIVKALARVEDQFQARRNATRLMIVIGDWADDDGKPDPYPVFGPDNRQVSTQPNPRLRYPNPEAGAEKKIAAKLSRVDAGDNPVRLLAIQVIRPDVYMDPELSPSQFKAQMGAIIGHMNDAARPGVSSTDEGSLGRYETLGFAPGEKPGLVDPVRKQKLLATLTAEFDRLRKRIGQLERQLEDLEAGAETGSRSSADLELLAKNNGIDLAEYLDKVKASPVFAIKGYVWEFEPAAPGKGLGPRQVRPVIKLARTEVETLRDMLKPFFETEGSGVTPDRVQAARRALDAITGRDDDRSNRRQDLRKPWMTVMFQSPLLTTPPNEVTDEMISANLLKLEVRYKKLVDLLTIDTNNMSLLNVWRIVPGERTGSYKVTNFDHPDGKKVKRFYAQAGDPTEYCWLIQDEEMP